MLFICFMNIAVIAIQQQIKYSAVLGERLLILFRYQ